ncbi:hypothetical protein AVEN_49410-1 [Araneus ventricosus]|uniref:Uncharacterized protein n=1 Tax=Araneus ventricosus TaxID=182803 RepID=A0A4Y2CNM2_ARAVE|nr:hypothetical protein AVEN_49410-1 [Araneus ventricosus]
MKIRFKNQTSIKPVEEHLDRIDLNLFGFRLYSLNGSRRRFSSKSKRLVTSSHCDDGSRDVTRSGIQEYSGYCLREINVQSFMAQRGGGIQLTQ